MTNKEKQLTCKDLVQGQFNHVEQTYREALNYYMEFDGATEGEQIALKVIPALATGCTMILKPSEI